jgi:peptide/nickel transport system ATP-binding protein
MGNAQALLAIDNLSVEFRTRTGLVRALDRVSFDVSAGEIIGVVGESGSGKSVTAYTIAGILDPSAHITSGRIDFQSRDLLKLGGRARRQICGRQLSVIFQHPRIALNQIRPVGLQIEDVVRAHTSLTRAEAQRRAFDMLEAVKIADPQHCMQLYPFQLSGGMCQRIMIAMALSCNPRLLLADEPTTGLDVTTQAVIMDLIQELGKKLGMTAILITHDLALAAERCDRIVVMHAGQVMEIAPTAELFRNPMHPYTRRLGAATPGPVSDISELDIVPGSVPDLRRQNLPPCRYAERCERRIKECDIGPVPRVAVGRDHFVACKRAL